jgi:hypothetical protein
MRIRYTVKQPPKKRIWIFFILFILAGKRWTTPNYYSEYKEQNHNMVAVAITSNIHIKKNDSNRPSTSSTGYEYSTQKVATTMILPNTSATVWNADVEANTLSQKKKVPYYKLWNHSTQSIHVPWRSTDDPLTSLEILQQVLNNLRNEDHYTAAEDSCFLPDTNSTRALAESVRKEEHTLSLPILNMGMPKAGTTSLDDFFLCAGLRSNHSSNGPLMLQGVNAGKPPIASSVQMLQKGRGLPVQVFTQLDDNYGTCAFPQIQLLDELHQEQPNATFILNFRPVMDWIKSARAWQGMADRWSKCKLPGLVCKGKGKFRCSDENLHSWWCGHVQHIREFVKRYPSHKLIELDLYDGPGTSKVMAELFGANQTCWGKSNTNELLERERSHSGAKLRVRT